MKRVAVITFSVAFPGEKGLSRMHFLAECLAAGGFAVDLITSSFQHWEKRQRDRLEAADVGGNCRVVLIDEPGYRKNLDLRRILSHRVFARNTLHHLLRGGGYDLLYCMIPDNYLAAQVGLFAKRRGIPYVIDVEDLWPEAMRMVFDVPVLSDLAFSYFTVNARRAYESCDAVVGSSDTYRDQPLKYGVDVQDRTTVYVGNDAERFMAGVSRYTDAALKEEGTFLLSYAGTIGTSYDIRTLILAADRISRQGKGRLRVDILGDGPLRAECESLAKSLSGDVRFAGFLPYEQMAARLAGSDAVINSLVRKAPQSIVSKIGDYLCSGRPMINTGTDPEFTRKVAADGFGINVEPENPDKLADAIAYLMDNPGVCSRMGASAKKTAAEQFDRNKTYKNIVRVVERQIGMRKKRVE